MVESKVNKLSNEQLKGSHWMPADLDRRWEQYVRNNDIFELGENMQPMVRFFQENKTEAFEIECNGEEFEMFESMRIYIERNGRPYNYLPSVSELNTKREEHLTVEEKEEKDRVQSLTEKELKEVDRQRKHLEQLAERRLKDIEKHMKELDLCDKLNMR